MNIKETVAAATSGLVELDRQHWLAYLLTVKVSTPIEKRWQIDLLSGAQNAQSELILVERSQARAMCGFPALQTVVADQPDGVATLIQMLESQIAGVAPKEPVEVAQK